MHILNEIKERMEEELEALCKKESLTPTEIDLIGEMVDVVKDVETVYAMKDYKPEDWMRGYSRGYDEDYSMTRMPYTRRVSRDDEKHDMIEHLNTMMMNARTPEERESYRSAIEHMRRS